MSIRNLLACSSLMIFIALASCGQKASGPTTQPILRIGIETKASGPTTQPILRIGTETHMFMYHLDIDSDGRYILTASEDKTARLWDAKDGKLLRVFRPPIDRGNEGELYACALSPDGRVAVVAGSTGFHWSRYASIYVFDTNTGVMIKNITGFPYSIHDLEFSLNGRYLAAALWKDGVRIIDTSSLRITHSLKGYPEICRISFDRTGRLATVCIDGTVRLYDASFELSTSKKTSRGIWPHCISFSLYGGKIAVGFRDSNRIEVFSGDDLDFLYEPQVRGSKDTAHFSLCWSKDGESLYAGGWYCEYRGGTWRYMIEKFSSGGLIETYPVSTDTVFDIKMMPDGGIVYCSGAPDLGRLDQQGRSVFVRHGESYQYNGQREYLRINADGTEIGFTPMGKQPLAFDVKKCRLLDRESRHPLARTSSSGISVSNWQGSNAPVINDIKVGFLGERERCHSVSISSSGEYVLLGTDWTVYCLDRRANIRWKIRADTAWAVNIAGNDKVFAAAYTGGTIRWHRLSNGEVLLTLFVHNDGKRWVIWTPTGYFAASEGGDTLAGWHFNNGSDKGALFYFLSRFAEQFHRPDVIQRVLKYGSVEQALAEANRRKRIRQESSDLTEFLPPMVTILSPENRATIEAERLELQLLISTVPGNPATELHILVNSRPAKDVREIRSAIEKVGEERRNISVGLSDGEYQVDVLAKNKAGFGDPARIHVVYEKKTRPRQNLKVLAVGISNHAIKALSLKYAAKDVQDFVALMKRQEGKLYEDVAVYLLNDTNATKKAIEEGLFWLRTQKGAEDLFVIFLAGHMVRAADGEFYYLCSDTDPNAVEQTALPTSVISGRIRDLSGRTVVLLDTRYPIDQGSLPMGMEAESSGIMSAFAAPETEAVVLSACSDDQYSQDSDRWRNGAFAKALLDGLGGNADYTKDGQISLNELGIYVRKGVKSLTGGSQIPVSEKPLTARDFPIAIVSEE